MSRKGTDAELDRMLVIVGSHRTPRASSALLTLQAWKCHVSWLRGHTSGRSSVGRADPLRHYATVGRATVVRAYMKGPIPSSETLLLPDKWGYHGATGPSRRPTFSGHKPHAGLEIGQG